MREILFRGKRVDNGEWVYGTPIYDGKIVYILSGVIEANEEYICIEDWHPVIPETVGQYTGLDDKNGVKIFEGDVVRCCGGEYYQGIYEFYENVEVKFETYALSCLYGSDSLEVIGNIHDNPELPEVQSEKP